MEWRDVPGYEGRIVVVPSVLLFGCHSARDVSVLFCDVLHAPVLAVPPVVDRCFGQTTDCVGVLSDILLRLLLPGFLRLPKAVE